MSFGLQVFDANGFPYFDSGFLQGFIRYRSTLTIPHNSWLDIPVPGLSTANGIVTCEPAAALRAVIADNQLSLKAYDTAVTTTVRVIIL